MNSIKNYTMDFQNATLSFTLDNTPDTSFEFCDPTEFEFTECDEATINGVTLTIVSFQDADAPGCVALVNNYGNGKHFYMSFLSFCQHVECF